MSRFTLRADRGETSESLLDRAAALGLDAVEVGWPLSDADSDRLVRGRSTGVQVSSLDLGATEDAAEVIDGLEAILDFLGRVSCRRLLVCGPCGVRDRAAALDTLVGGLRQLADRTEALGIAVVVRAATPDDGDQPLLETTADLRVVLARVNRGNVSAAADLSAMTRADEDPIDSAADLVGRLGHVSLGQVPLPAEERTMQQFLDDVAGYGYGDVVALRGSTDAVQRVLDANAGSSRADHHRLEATQKFLNDEGFDAMVMNASKNIVALTGYWPMNGTVLAFVPAAGEPHLHVPAGEETWASKSGWANIHVYQAGRIDDPSLADSMGAALGGLAMSYGLRGRRVGIEGPFRAQVPPHMAHEVSGRHESLRPVIAAAFDTAPEFLPATWNRVRAAKTDQEVRAIRRSAAIADVGLRTFRDGLAVGVRDIDLATAVESAIETFGVGHDQVTRVRSYAFVMGGEQTSQTHLDYEFSSTRRQRAGDNVLMELAVVADGYWQDLSRAFVIGDPTPDQQDIFDVADAAYRAAVAAAVPGATGHEVDLAARQVIGDAGMSEAYPHQTGHGVGVAFHEQYPLIKPGSDHVLERGNVIALEPGVYVPGVGGVRNEDNLLVGSQSGAETLQSIPHAVAVAR